MPTTKWMTLEQALREFCPPDLVRKYFYLKRKIQQLAARKYLDTPSRARLRNYTVRVDTLQMQLQEILVARFVEDSLIVKGHDERRTVDEPATRFPTTAWRRLRMQFEDSSVLDGKAVIRDVRVSRAIDGTAGSGGAQSKRRLRLSKSKYARVDGREVALTPGLMKLLRIFALAKMNGEGPLTKSELEKRLGIDRKRTSQKAVDQMIYRLRGALKQSNRKRTIRQDYIRFVSKEGYSLADDIEVEGVD